MYKESVQIAAVCAARTDPAPAILPKQTTDEDVNGLIARWQAAGGGSE